MLSALWRGASGMQAQQIQVDSLANDLANVNTTSYKQSRVEFADLLYRPVQEGGMPVDRPPAPLSPPAVGTGVRVAAVEKEFTQGALVATGDPLHLAIQGPGFFGVVNAAGEFFLTRDGSFHRDARGNLVNAGGFYLDVAFTLPEAAEGIAVSSDGRVTAIIDGEEQALGEINLYHVPNPAGLEAAGANLYQETAASGMGTAALPGGAGLGTIQSGYLEGANVEVATAMTRLLLAQRAYELNSRAVRVADEMWGLANNLRR